MKSQQKVYFHSADRQLSIANRKKIRSFILYLFETEKKPLARLDYIFCSDSYLLDINKKYLNHDYFTDIISFDLSESSPSITGEIYISLDRVKDNAQNLKLPYYHEILRVLFHGALHLCGYGDSTEEEIKIMRQKEDFYLEQWHKN